MINKDELVCIGYIKRPHGFKGEIQFQLNKEIALDKGDFVFVAIDGQFIPYPIEKINASADEPIAKLRFVDDFDRAKSICAKEIFIETDGIEGDSEVSLIGYTVIDKQLGVLGSVKDIEYFPQQIMLIVEYNGKDCYIPMNEHFIITIVEKNKEIYCNLPEGLLDL